MRCVVPNCDHESSKTFPGVTYHAFPKEPLLCATWFKALHMASFVLQEHNTVCSRHFLQEDLLMTSTGLRMLRAGAVPFNDLKVCRICFASNCKLYPMTEYKVFSEAYETLTGLLISNNDNLPTCVCTDCAHELLNYTCFRRTSLRAHSTLIDIVKSHGYVTLELIQPFKGCYNPLNFNFDHDYHVVYSGNFNARVITNITAQNSDVIDHNNVNAVDACNDDIVVTSSLPEDGLIDNIKTENDAINPENVTNDTVDAYNSPEDDDVNDIEIEYNDTVKYECFNTVDVTNDDMICTAGVAEDDTVYRSNKNDAQFRDVIKHNNVAVDASYDHIVFTSSLPGDDLVDNIKIENDAINRDNLNNVHVTNDNTACISRLPEDVSVDEIKIENDAVNRDNLNSVDVTNGTAGTSSLPEDDNVDDIKIEHNDTIKCEFFSTNDDIVCTAGVAEDDSVHGSNKNDWVINQDIANEESNKYYIKIEDVNIGEDYFSGDSRLPEAVLNAKRSVTRVQEVTKLPKQTVQVKVDTSQDQEANGELLIDNAVSCDISSYQTHSDRNYFSHLKAHDATNSYAIHRLSLISHVKRHSDEKLSSYNVYDSGYKNMKNNLTKHLQTHSSDILYSCDICDKHFNRKLDLTRHLRVHSGDKPYLCKICNKTFTLKSNLKVHLRIHSGEKPYSCNECNKTFYVKAALIYHLRTHSGEKPYSCEVCNKAFNRKGDVKKHMRIHLDEKPYSCKICNKTFVEKNKLTLHLRAHSGDKPYACKICNKSFTRKGVLTIHWKTHSGERPYSCEVCNKAFNRKGDANRHLRIHTREKPYSCKVCNKTFTQKGHIIRHLRTHSGDKLYSCKTCNKAFTRKTNLIKHLRTHTHTDKNP